MRPTKRRTPSYRPAARRTRRHLRLHTTAALVSAPLASPWEWWQARSPILSAGLGAFLLFFVLAALFVTDLFYVSEIQVEGLRYLPKDEVERATGVLNYSVFFVDPKTVERTLLKKPEIKSARVLVGIPHRVVVEVQERDPVLTWARGNETYWVDTDGIGFRVRSPRTDLPQIRDVDQSPIKPGQLIHPKAVAAMYALLAAWPEMPRATEWTNANGLALNDEHGWKAVFGFENDMDLKVAKYKTVVSQILTQRTKPSVVDVSKGEVFFR